MTERWHETLGKTLQSELGKNATLETCASHTVVKDPKSGIHLVIVDHGERYIRFHTEPVSLATNIIPNSIGHIVKNGAVVLHTQGSEKFVAMPVEQLSHIARLAALIKPHLENV